MRQCKNRNITGRGVGLPGGYRITAQAQCIVMVQKRTGRGPMGFTLRRLARRPVFLQHFHTSSGGLTLKQTLVGV